MTTTRRITLKIGVAYLVACVPTLWVASLSGPHGPVWEFPEALMWGLVLPLEGMARFVFEGKTDALPFVGAFLVLLTIGLFCTWLTERFRGPQRTPRDGSTE
jgi:hypothetical protein